MKPTKWQFIGFVGAAQETDKTDETDNIPRGMSVCRFRRAGKTIGWDVPAERWGVGR